MNTPALLTSVSTRPKRSSAVLNTFSAVSGSAHVALHCHDVRIGYRLDRPRCRDHPAIPISESLNDAGADALRCSGYNGYFLLCVHDPALSVEDARFNRLAKEAHTSTSL
jgi:hypothetical protein